MAHTPHAHGLGRHDRGHLDHDHHGHPHLANHHLGTVFALATALNLALVVIEGLFGFLSHSMALLADAGHNFSDVLGLVAAWTASMLAQRGPTQRYTYGLRSSSILAALLNAIILLIAVGGIVLEAVQRLLAPEPVAGMTVIIVASAGVVINGASALLLGGSHHGDLNVRSAFAHMASDAVVSVGVVAAGVIILLTGWLWFDPAVSIVIAVVIVFGTWRLLRRSLDMALHAVPAGIDAAEVRGQLAAIAGVAAVHDLHIWPMSTTTTALTCHLVMPGGHPGDDFLIECARTLKEMYRIGHSTLQIETRAENGCASAPDWMV